MSERIGFVGLGIMGGPMARNLADAGFELTVFNRTSSKAEKLAEGRSARVAYDLGELARDSDVVITMLPGPPEVEAVIAGRDGLLDAMRQGTLLVDMSTSSPVLARGLARKAAAEGYRDARRAGLGRRRGGGEGDAIHHGGRKRGGLREGQETPSRRWARRSFTWASAGAGQVTKAANQIVVALILEAVSEALVLGSKAGVEPAKIIEVLSGGLAANKVMEVKRDKLLDHDFEPGGKVEFHHKDLGIALQAGREYGVSLPVTAIVDQMFGELEARGRAVGIMPPCLR